MRLANFIEAHTDPILSDWVDFARDCCPVAEHMDQEAIEDHALDVLHTIVQGIRSPVLQPELSPAERAHAFRGRALDEAAGIHGASRAEIGFTVSEMVAEYSALRASILRRWASDRGCPFREEDGRPLAVLTEDEIYADLSRFNSALDHAMEVSVARYSHNLARSKEMFVGILGHDLQTPLSTVIVASQLMLEMMPPDDPCRSLTSRISQSASRMSQMVGELLDFTRSRIGAGIPVHRSAVDLEREVAMAMEELETVYPTQHFELTSEGDLHGCWDRDRIRQVLTNLVGNAVQHGDPARPIHVSLRGAGGEVVVRVHNSGETIPPDQIHTLFDPFKRGQAHEQSTASSGNLGLGLYIAERIVTAHKGSIHVTSTPSDGTWFTVELPRDVAV